ncbi:MAG TPA: serine hydrolase [Ktedonobacterales bacterium]
MPQQTDQLPQITASSTAQARLLVSRPVIRLGILAVLASLLGGSIWLALASQQQVSVTNGSDRWASDQSATAASIPFTAPVAAQIPVDPAFAAYYQARTGAQLLGAPITPGFAIPQGWMQFFSTSALFLPGVHHAASTPASQADQQIASLIQNGLQDRRSGVVQLPLLQSLLTVGSQAIVGGGLTYVDLRSATKPDQMTPAPATVSTARGVFIQTGTRGGQKIGHTIPAALWNYINRRDVSPDGWQTDFGAPLTEAIPFVTVQYGASHRLLVQAFWRGALVMDRDAGPQSIQPLATGVAYLQTLVPPTSTLNAGSHIWASRALNILDQPAVGKPLLHIGPNFPLALTGAMQWSAGALWYRVAWQTPKASGAGWAPASSLTFSTPAKANAAAWSPASGSAVTMPAESSPWASFARLSPDLAHYLASQGNNTSAVVYDLTRQRYYADHLDNQYLMGNAMKLPFLLAFLAMTEQQGRRPNSDEMQSLTAMMATGDDDAGADLYNEIGRALGMQEYLDQLGVTGLEPENDDWVYTTGRPLAMVQLLTLLYQGKILTPPDQSLALSLLEHTAPDQQVGVGDTRPTGAVVALKDGWVMGTDGLWAMNTSGIVTVGSETYIISVFSAHLNSLSAGQDVARQVCTRVAASLA